MVGIPGKQLREDPWDPWWILGAPQERTGITQGLPGIPQRPPVTPQGPPRTLREPPGIPQGSPRDPEAPWAPLGPARTGLAWDFAPIAPWVN